VTVLHVLSAIGGALLVGITLMSAVRTFVLPRGEAANLTRVVFVTSRFFFNARIKLSQDFSDKDRVFAYFAPVTLLILPVVWLILVGTGYTLVFWGTGVHPLRAAAKLSGSSLFTLGVSDTHGAGRSLIAFSEAGLGIGLLALLISYLPSMYSAFQRREAAVALLEVRAGSPPSALNMLERYHVIHGLDRLDALWPAWEEWFADIEESHTSLGAMAFFRSPQPQRSWITAAGAVLDTASFVASSLDRERTPEAEICVRAGYLALRHIADFFNMPYDPDPAPDDPISIGREEYDAMWDRLAELGVPLAHDREAAWRAFRGWRVNYDEILLSMAGLIMAPPAPWSSDRSRRFRRPPLNATRRFRR
jgi:hypothetical protein